MTPDDYCRERAAPRGSTLHYCLRLLPAERRRAITALHALGREVGDAAGNATDTSIAQVKLAWWRGEIATIYEGRPAHPVALALQSTAVARTIGRAELEALVDGAQRGVERRPFADFAALEAHCARTAGALGALSAKLLGARADATLGCACELAVATRLIEIIRDVGSDARAGRMLIPLDELARAGLTPAEIVARHSSPAFTALMSLQAARARARIERATAGAGSGDSGVLAPALAAAAIQRVLLDEIERDGFRVLERRVALTPVRKLLIATRALRAARSS